MGEQENEGGSITGLKVNLYCHKARKYSTAKNQSLYAHRTYLMQQKHCIGKSRSIIAGVLLGQVVVALCTCLDSEAWLVKREGSHSPYFYFTEA